MYIRLPVVGDVENSDEIRRIPPKGIVASVQSPVFKIYFVQLGARREEIGWACGVGHMFSVLLFQSGADDAGQIPYVLGDEEVIFHELFDGSAGRPVPISQTFRDVRLHVERKSFFSPTGDTMQLTADVPEEVFRRAECRELFIGKHAVPDELGRVDGAVQIISDPVEGLQVAQTALAVLDIGFDQIAALALFVMARIPFSELGLNEVPSGSHGDFCAEAFHKRFGEMRIATNEPRFEQACPHGHILPRKPQALVQRARRMADAEAEIPKHEKDEFDNAFAPRGSFEWAKENQIEIGKGRKQPAPVATRCDDRQMLGVGRILDLAQMPGREFVQDPDQQVVEFTERPRRLEFGQRPAREARVDFLARTAHKRLEVIECGFPAAFGVACAGRKGREMMPENVAVQKIDARLVAQRRVRMGFRAIRRRAGR